MTSASETAELVRPLYQIRGGRRQCRVENEKLDRRPLMLQGILSRPVVVPLEERERERELVNNFLMILPLSWLRGGGFICGSNRDKAAVAGSGLLPPLKSSKGDHKLR